MQIIPVIDVRDGVAVHAIGGHRHYYRPVQSAIADCSDPVRILQALRRRFRSQQCYIADLDGLQGLPIATSLLGTLAEQGVPLVVDAGLRTLEEAESLVALNIQGIVLGSETVGHADLIRELIARHGADRFIFSIDLRELQLIAANPAWQALAPVDLAVHVAELGVTRFILLDLSAVGTCRGVSTVGLCRELRTRLPHATIIPGGGVRSEAHLVELEQAGADGALVASAIHNGTLTADQVRRYRARTATCR